MPVRENDYVWVLMAFGKEPGDRLANQWVLSSFTDDDARQLLGLPADHPGWGDHPVTQPMVSTLRRFLDVPIDLDEYDYLIGAQAAQ